MSRNQKSAYRGLFDEIKNINPRQNQILNDANTLSNDINTEVKSFKDTMNKRKDKNQNLVDNFKKQITNIHKKTDECKKNFTSLEEQIKKKEVINKKELEKLPLNELFDIPADVVIPEWFDHFKKGQFEKLNTVLEDMASKLYKARITDEIKENRERLQQQAKTLANDITENHMHAENVPKEKIIQYEKIICELQQYDYIIPQIMAELASKAAQFGQGLLIQMADFSKKCNNELEKVKKSTFANDDAFKYEFNNLSVMEPGKVRTHRYGIVLKNEDLLTLHDGIWMTERIPFFFIEYFRERNRYLNLKDIQEIMVMPHTFFENLIPPGGVLDWNNLNYSSVKAITSEYNKLNNTVFDKFSRILVGALLSANNFLLVEIRTKPEREILIYDSDFPSFGVFHEKIIRCIRAYIVEEYRNKTDENEGVCIDFGRQFVGRSVNCPQLSFPYQNGLYFAKNLQLAAEGQNITSISYRNDTLQKFRMELFSTCLRIGVNDDRSIPFDVLI